MTEPRTHPLVQKVTRFLASPERQRREERIVVAVSGGPDSVSLLRALVLVHNDVQAAHLNHLLRGDESDGDEAFVRDVCQQLGVQTHVARRDVAGQARREHDNLEQAARNLRYDWLAEVARQTGAVAVATGHTADDQAETVLHRLLRGAGLKGLRGIASARPLTPGIELIRPLLEVTRAEVIDFLTQTNQPHRLDRTNLDPQRTRNRIRHGLLPRLQAEFNPEIVPLLCRLAEQADEVFRDIEAQAAALLQVVELPRAGNCLIFDRGKLAAAQPNGVRELFRLIWEREGWPQGDMDARHWQRLAELARGGHVALDLPAGIQVRLLDRVIQVMKRET